MWTECKKKNINLCISSCVRLLFNQHVLKVFARWRLEWKDVCGKQTEHTVEHLSQLQMCPFCIWNSNFGKIKRDGLIGQTAGAQLMDLQPKNNCRLKQNKTNKKKSNKKLAHPKSKRQVHSYRAKCQSWYHN